MTSSLVIFNVAMFGFQALLMWAMAGPYRVFEHVFALSLAGIREGFWWEFITHAFLHGNLLHLFVNMVGLWFAGRLVERIIGPWRLLLLYIFSAVAGGVLQMALGGEGAMLLGASGAVCGIVVAFCAMFPERELLLLLFFVLPLRMRAKFLGWALVLSSFVFLVTGFEPWIGHAAHLGGCIGGFLFVRLAGFSRPTKVEQLVFRRQRSQA